MDEVSSFLSFQVDKFTFRVATDRKYSTEGVWVKKQGSSYVLGVSDYLQQRSGDVAFVEVKPAGEYLSIGDEFAVMETIKVNISLSSPISGKVAEVNASLETSPEIVNQDPYASGWLAVIEGDDGEGSSYLMEAQDYLTKIKQEAEQDI